MDNDSAVICFKLKCKDMETDVITTDWTEIGNCGFWGNDSEAVWGPIYETP